MSIRDDILFCLKPRCPICRQAPLYKPWSLTVVDECPVCGTKLGQHDIGDGAAVFILFILCFLLIPLAWLFELTFAPPLWAHVVMVAVFGLAIIGVLLPASKAYIILLEYRHRR